MLSGKFQNYVRSTSVWMVYIIGNIIIGNITLLSSIKVKKKKVNLKTF